MRADSRALRALHFAALGAFVGSVGFSLAGIALLRAAPEAVARAGPLLPWLMKTPTWIYMLSLPVLVFTMYLRDQGWRRSMLLLLWGSVVGMIAELAGTTTGLPFGAYSYTAFLDPKILGHVPYLIPPSWYAVSMLSWDLAGRMTGRTASRVSLGALLMVLWDVALDPAMGAGFPVWRWETDGFFYGMPFINWIGWYITAFLIVGGYEVLTSRRGLAPNGSTPFVWLVNGAFSVGICALTGLWGAVLVGSLAVLAPIVVVGLGRSAVLSPVT